MLGARAALLVVALGARVAHADPADHHRRVTHYTAVAIGAALYGVSLATQRELAAAHCRWCTVPAVDREVREALHWRDTSAAGTLSTVLGYGVAPVLALSWPLIAARDEGSERWLDDSLPVLETAVYSALLDQVVKLAVARERPYAAFAPTPVHATADTNVSFFSGHTTLVFALAVSAGEVAHARHARYEPVVWAASLTLAAATGYLRIAADAHYLSDVVTGAAVGTAAALAVPRLLGTLPHGVVLAPTTTGAVLSGTW